MYIVYRVEHSIDKMGPYYDSWSQIGTFPSRIGIQTWFKVVQKGDWGHQGADHPSDYEDVIDSSLLKRDGVYKLCGFPNKKSIINWFKPEELKYLIKNGYRVRKFLVKERIVGISGKQCFFFRSDIIN